MRELKEQMRQPHERYGLPQRYEVVCSVVVGKSLLRVVYLSSQGVMPAGRAFCSKMLSGDSASSAGGEGKDSSKCGAGL